MARLETKKEYSAGGVVFRTHASGKGWEIVIIKRMRYLNESWSLPKGCESDGAAGSPKRAS